MYQALILRHFPVPTTPFLRHFGIWICKSAWSFINPERPGSIDIIGFYGELGTGMKLQKSGGPPRYLISLIAYYSIPCFSLYYKVVVFIAPPQGLCYTARDAVDWYNSPTAETVLERLQPQPFADLLIS